MVLKVFPPWYGQVKFCYIGSISLDQVQVKLPTGCHTLPNAISCSPDNDVNLIADDVPQGTDVDAIAARPVSS